MRFLPAALIAVSYLFAGAAFAQSEKRIFIIANSPDAYGVDRCLAEGSSCGAAAAAAYCQSKQFPQAASYRKIERDEITGAIPVSTVCGRHGCDDFIAIECSR